MYAHSPAELAQMAKRKHAALARFGGRRDRDRRHRHGDPGPRRRRLDPVAPGLLHRRRLRLRPLRPDAPGRAARHPRALSRSADARAAHSTASARLVVAAYVGSSLERDEALASRLARFVGRRLTRRIAGRMIPFAAIAFNAIGNERETRALADKAIKFYGG